MVENRSYAKQKVIVLNYPTCKDGWIACMFEEGIWGGVNGTLTL